MTKDVLRVSRQIERLSKELDRLEAASLFRRVHQEAEIERLCEENNLIYFPLNY